MNTAWAVLLAFVSLQTALVSPLLRWSRCGTAGSSMQLAAESSKAEETGKRNATGSGPLEFWKGGELFGNLMTGMGARAEADVRDVGVSANSASKLAAKGLGMFASVFDEAIAKPVKNAPSALKTLSDPDSWDLLQSGVNPFDNTPKMIGTFDATSTKQRAKLKRKSPEFEKKPNPLAPDVMMRTMRTLPSTLKYEYDLRTQAREKEAAAALNRQLGDGSSQDTEETAPVRVLALGSGLEDAQVEEAKAPRTEQLQGSFGEPVASAAVASVDFLSGSTAINPSAYLVDDDDDDDAVEGKGEGERGQVVVGVATETDWQVTNLLSASGSVTDVSAAPVAATVAVTSTSTKTLAAGPEPVVVDTTAKTVSASLETEDFKRVGAQALDVVFFLAETAIKAAGPILRDGGATALGRIQDALFPDDGIMALRPEEKKQQAGTEGLKSSGSTALAKLAEPRGAEKVGGSKLLSTLKNQKSDAL